MFHRLIRVAAVLLMVAALLATGCIFSPDRKPPSGIKPIDYLSPDSPQSVLQNLIKAYTNRDSVGTDSVYDVSYTGVANYPGAPSGGTLFSKADEVRHVGRLKLDPNIVSILLDLGPAPSWQRLGPSASDPADWAVIPIPASRIEITDNSTQTRYEATNDIIEYTFKPNVSAPGDTVWKVIRWTEFAN